MVTAIDIARHLVWLSSKESELDPVTHMQVQKLVYYVQGWSLAINDAPMFSDKIQAWRYGPVIASVNRELKQYDDNPIPVSFGEDSRELSGDEKKLVRRVWESYKQFSAIGLSQLTHTESPWADAYDSSDDEGRCRKEITREAMRSYFTQRYARRRLPGIDPARAALAENQVREGKLVPLDQIALGAR